MTPVPPLPAAAPSAPRVIDFHQHLWPPELIERLEARGRPPFLRGDALTTTEGTFRVDRSVHDLDRRIARLDGAGIDIAVISLQPTLGIERLPPGEREPLIEAYHGGVAALVSRSGGRLRALAAGSTAGSFDGICIGASRLLEPTGVTEILAGLERCEGILFVHPDRVTPPPAGAPPWWQSVAEYTAEMQAAFFAWIEHGAKSWPDLRVVFSLLAGGAPFQLERLLSRGVDLRRFTNAPVYLETSSYGRTSIDLTLAAFGIEHVVFGSDYPIINPEPTMNAVRSLGESAFRSICSNTPTRLLPPGSGSGFRHRQPTRSTLPDFGQQPVAVAAGPFGQART